jgi:formylglycine-generating enzyme required for sulfatase activity
MRPMRPFVLALSSSLVLALVACGSSPAATQAPTPTVAATEARLEPAAALAGPAEVVAAPREAPPKKPARGPSCDGRAGADEKCAGGSCCERLNIPATAVPFRKVAAGAVEKRQVKAFALDKLEVTVGRMRAWVAAGQPVPKVGDVLYDDGEGHTVKWSAKAKVQLGDKLGGGWKRYDTWAGGDDYRPKNFVTWYTAAAFCAWDGGRLPTDAEWVAAALGGAEDRPYPWGTEEPTPEHAVFNCMGDGNGQCALSDILPVGSRPKGAGRWGHLDLAGSMFEWTLDAAVAEVGSRSTEKARGGGFCYIGGVDRRANTGLRPAVFREESPDTVSHMTGVRCAYALGAASP